jgi:hypothetical protein
MRADLALLDHFGQCWSEFGQKFEKTIRITVRRICCRYPAE